jgi:hypothetical protein
LRFVGLLGKARVVMQLDVGFGAAVTPGAQAITYPALLDFPAPELSGYPRETVVAEKFHAMVYLRTMNSRMKDFYDVWLLASHFAFDGAPLASAVSATFATRETDVDVTPIAFTGDFTEQASTLARWRAFRGRLPNDESPAELSEVVIVLAEFLLPVARLRQRRELRPELVRGRPVVRGSLMITRSAAPRRLKPQREDTKCPPLEAEAQPPRPSAPAKVARTDTHRGTRARAGRQSRHRQLTVPCHAFRTGHCTRLHPTKSDRAAQQLRPGPYRPRLGSLALGRHSQRERVRGSEHWNDHHVDEVYQPGTAD